jgi:replication factor C small subunit
MSLSVNEKEYIFIEKFRPKNINDIILPEATKNMVKKWIEDEEIPNLLLSGRVPGSGKSSFCHMIIEETGAEALFVNASLNANMDFLRNKLQGFASTASFDGKPKIVILDEADFISATGQASLRGLIEEFSKNTRFILTCNFKNKILEPIRNRLINIDFDELNNNNKAEMAKGIALRTIAILKHEKIKHNIDDVKWLVKHYFPSSRQILNKIQELSTSGELKINRDELDADSLNDEIIKNILNKDFDSLRRNCSKLPDPGSLFLTLFDNIDKFPQALRPNIIIAIGRWQSYDSQVRDRLINTVACGTELMEIL